MHALPCTTGTTGTLPCAQQKYWVTMSEYCLRLGLTCRLAWASSGSTLRMRRCAEMQNASAAASSPGWAAKALQGRCGQGGSCGAGTRAPGHFASHWTSN